MPIKDVRRVDLREMSVILRALARAIEHLASATKARTQRAPELFGRRGWASSRCPGPPPTHVFDGNVHLRHLAT
jgi:hypothetical protein